MAKKRKSLATSIDEVDRTMYSTFCSAANSLSQLYTQAMNRQKLSFQAGERHGMEKLYQWILRRQEEGSRVTAIDILSYLQTELDYHGEEPSTSPKAPLLNQHSNYVLQLFPGSSPAPIAGQGFQHDHCHQQPKDYIFSDALSDPVCWSLQNYNDAHDYNPNVGQPSSNASRSNKLHFLQHQIRASNSNNPNDGSMDMNADNPGPQTY